MTEIERRLFCNGVKDVLDATTHYFPDIGIDIVPGCMDVQASDEEDTWTDRCGRDERCLGKVHHVRIIRRRDFERSSDQPAERYIIKPAVEDAEIVSLTFERGVLEVYGTIISALQGLAGALLVFFIVTLIAFVIVRIVEMIPRARQGDG